MNKFYPLIKNYIVLFCEKEQFRTQNIDQTVPKTRKHHMDFNMTNKKELRVPKTCIVKGREQFLN